MTMIRSERHDDVTLVTLDRPERRNAVNHDALVDLREVIAGARDSRALVLTGAGGHFCAGADLTGVEDTGFVALLSEVLRALQTSSAPTIAAVSGAALGAGTQLASACDLRVATPDSSFGVPAGKLGLMVDLWTVERLAHLVGGGTARSILLAAEVLDGARAHQLGLVQRLGDLDDALAWAASIATLAPLTLAGHKHGINLVEAGDPDAAERYADAFRAAWRSDDLQEGLTAFRERRPPQFRGA